MDLLKNFISLSEDFGIVSAFDLFDLNNLLDPEILSSKERNVYSKFTSRKRQNEFVAGRSACKKAFFKMQSNGMAHNDVCCAEKFSSVSILNSETGSPFIENFDLCVSVSHSHGVAIASVSEHAVGVDIEQVDPKRISALRRMSAEYTSETECSPEEIRDLTILWTLKESLGKALLTGIVGEFSRYDTGNFRCEDGIYLCDFKNFPSFSGVAIADSRYAVAIVTKDFAP